jgi:hypothetical protein
VVASRPLGERHRHRSCEREEIIAISLAVNNMGAQYIDVNIFDIDVDADE